MVDQSYSWHARFKSRYDKNCWTKSEPIALRADQRSGFLSISTAQTRREGASSTSRRYSLVILCGLLALAAPTTCCIITPRDNTEKYRACVPRLLSLVFFTTFFRIETRGCLRRHLIFSCCSFHYFLFYLSILMKKKRRGDSFMARLNLILLISV